MTGCESLQFFPNPRSKSLIDDVIRPMSDNTGAACILGVGPIIEPIDLLVKIRWESFHPRTQFFSDEFLKKPMGGGAILADQVKSLSWTDRNCEYAGSVAPPELIADVIAKLRTLLP